MAIRDLKRAFDTFALLFGIDTPQGKTCVPVTFNANLKGIVTGFMHVLDKAFLKDSGTIMNRICRDAKRDDEP